MARLDGAVPEGTGARPHPPAGVAGCTSPVRTGWRGVLGHVAIGALYIVAGITVIADPVMASKIITVILAATLVAVGLMRIIMAFQVRSEPGWAWAAVAGVFTIGLGLVIMAEWPLSGLFVIGLFIAVEMLIQGFSDIGMALARRTRVAWSHRPEEDWMASPAARHDDSGVVIASLIVRHRERSDAIQLRLSRR
ncbi:MAG: hypothetical protein EA406_10985 [Rhodospirillales bacterium]|nr:MAG: hypothetical protein EA406_10985 [Rhodospirillales bacterium]